MRKNEPNNLFCSHECNKEAHYASIEGFEDASYDIFYSIAMELEPKDLNAFCRTNKKYLEYCNRKRFKVPYAEKWLEELKVSMAELPMSFVIQWTTTLKPLMGELDYYFSVLGPINRLLIKAYKAKDINDMRSLLNAGANSNFIEGGRPSILAQAVRSGNTKHIRLFLEYGANPNYRLEGYGTLLQMYSILDIPDVVKLLLNKGANPNAISRKNPYTPLILASMYNRVEYVRLLLANGADVHLKGNSGTTPLEIASKKGHTEIVQMLKEAINKNNQ